MRNALLIAGLLSSLFAPAKVREVDPYKVKAEAELELVFCLPAMAKQEPKPEPKPDDKPKPGAAPLVETIAKQRLQLLFFTDSQNCQPCKQVKQQINELIQHHGYTTGITGDICTIDASESRNGKLFRSWKINCTPVLIVAEYLDESKQIAREIGRHEGVPASLAEWLETFSGEWRHGK